MHAAALLGDRTPLEQYDVPTWCKVLHVNLTAPFILTQVLLPEFAQVRRRLDHIRQQRRGQANRGRSGAPTRSPSPGWNRCAACCPRNSTAKPNIRVNSVNPGRMRTADARRRLSGRGSEHGAVAASVSGPFLYLLSAQSRGIDGQYIDAQ